MTGATHLRFYAGTSLVLAAGHPVGTLCLLDSRPRPLSPEASGRLAASLAELGRAASDMISRQRESAAIRRLRTELAVKDALIREQAAALAHSRKTFERASAAARIGVWECDLHDESLRWTDVVYEIFDIPRSAILDRTQILRLYSEASRTALQAIRSRAIRERSGFNLDAEIVTAKGVRRWVRLTATVECEDGVAVRIFGMKQDITKEKILADRTRYMAEFDLMTGLANRSLFQARLAEMDRNRAGARAVGALLLVDLDGFKLVNDTYGHALGDECLREVASRLRTCCGEADLVARIGGDEFGVVVGAHLDQSALAGLGRRIVETLGKPVDRRERTYRIGASVGIAEVDGCTPSELFRRADTALYAAKAAGRNTYRLFSPTAIAAQETGLPLPRSQAAIPAMSA